MLSNIRTELSEIIVNVDYDSLPSEVIHQCKRCLLDFFGVALASGKTDLFTSAARIFNQVEVEQAATVIGEGGRFSPISAVLLNGIKAHSLDMDDGNRYGSIHPAVVVIPAALVAAEQVKASGRELIAAVVAGYEILVLISKAINPAHLRRGFHTTACLGAFGAAAATSKILGLNRSQIKNGLSIAGLSGGGLLETLASGQMMKPYQTARASQAGFISAQLARHGAEGPELIFEGGKGFFQAYAGQKAELEILPGMMARFEIMNIYFKLYPACRHIHPVLDCVAEIISNNPLEPEKITAIEIDTYSIAHALTGHRATEMSETSAKFSMPVCVALMLVYGGLDKSELTPLKISQPLVQALSDKVIIRIDPERDQKYPKERGARVTIHANGESLSHEVIIPKGEPENPVSDTELEEKYNRNAELFFSWRRAQELYQKIFNLENISTISLTQSLVGEQ